MEEPRDTVGFRLRDLSDDVSFELSLISIDLVEEFATTLLPLVWSKSVSVLQVQVSSIVMARQLKSKSTTVSDLTRELDRPRGSIDSAVEALMERDWIECYPDPDDGRKNLLRVPTSRADDVGSIEVFLVEFHLRWYERFKAVLASTEGASKQRDAEIQKLKDALEALSKL